MTNKSLVFLYRKLFDIGNAETHLALILIRLLGIKLVQCMTAAKFALTPAGLTALIGE
jgi:hypothetical protein